MDRENRNPTFARDLIQSIVQIVFLTFFYGVIPLALTISANSSWKIGNYESYEKLTKVAVVFLVIGWVLLGLEIFAIFYFFFALVTSGF